MRRRPQGAVGRCRWIAQNAGVEGGVVVARGRRAAGRPRLNAATGEYGDLMAQGVIDPVKVTRSAVQNAASIAGMLLTTEVLVTDKPEPEAAEANGTATVTRTDLHAAAARARRALRRALLA